MAFVLRQKQDSRVIHDLGLIANDSIFRLRETQATFSRKSLSKSF